MIQNILLLSSTTTMLFTQMVLPLFRRKMTKNFVWKLPNNETTFYCFEELFRYSGIFDSSRQNYKLTKIVASAGLPCKSWCSPRQFSWWMSLLLAILTFLNWVTMILEWYDTSTISPIIWNIMENILAALTNPLIISQKR